MIRTRGWQHENSRISIGSLDASMARGPGGDAERRPGQEGQAEETQQAQEGGEFYVGPPVEMADPCCLRSWRSWRLGERQILAAHDRECLGKGNRRRGLPHAYRSWPRPVGIPL